MTVNSEQFIKNTGTISKLDMKKLNSVKVLIVGLGGLGGHIANGLVRLGVADLVLVDYDIFQLSNLNRQIYSNHENIGNYKASITKEELLKINPEAKVSTYLTKIQDEVSNISEVDIIIDAVDNLATKLYLEEASLKFNIPLLHGACGGWYGQVSLIKSSIPILSELYKDNQEGLEKDLMNPYFAPSIVASYMLSEFVKWIKSKEFKYNQLLLIDVYNNNLESIDLGGD